MLQNERRFWGEKLTQVTVRTNAAEARGHNVS